MLNLKIKHLMSAVAALAVLTMVFSSVSRMSPAWRAHSGAVATTIASRQS